MKRTAVLAFIFAVASAFSTSAIQEPTDAQTPQPNAQYGGQRSPRGRWGDEQLKQMQKQQSTERQKQLKADTEKLLQLATELKGSVDKTNENILSLEVVKKAEQIEKLAKHIKTNMRDQVR